MPLAVITDGETLHRAILTRLLSCGFPLAWYSTRTVGGGPPSSIRARTPRHAVEIAAYLPHGGTTTRRDFGSLVPVPNRTALRSLVPGSQTDGTRKAASTPLSQAHIPIVIVIAISGDAAFDVALGLLLSDGMGETHASVDRSLLAGSILVIIGPLSEIAVSNASKRCKRVGVRMVMVATDGDPLGASRGALNMWCASEHSDAIVVAMPIMHALATTIKVIGRDPRDACNPRLAQVLTNFSLSETVKGMLASGTSSATAISERRALRLAQELMKARRHAEYLHALENTAASASERALEADERALRIVEENAKLHNMLNEANSKMNELVEVCEILELQVGKTTDSLRFAIRSRDQLEATTAELRTGKLVEKHVVEELVRAQQNLKKEVRARHILRSKTNDLTANVASLHHQILNKNSELCMQYQQMQAERRELERLRSILDRLHASKSTKISGLFSEIKQAQYIARIMQTLVMEVTSERDIAREEISLIRGQYNMLQKLEAGLVCAAKSYDVAFARTGSIQSECECLKNALAYANDAVSCAQCRSHELLRDLMSIQNALDIAGTKYEIETAAAVSRAESTAAFALSAADHARANAEARARRLKEVLTFSSENGERKAIQLRDICTKLAATHAKILVAQNYNVLLKLLDAHLSMTNSKVTQVTGEMNQLKWILQTMQRKRTNATSAMKSALDRARADTEAAKRARTAAEITAHCTLSKLAQLREKYQQADKRRTLAEDGEKIAKLKIVAERAAGAAQQRALVDLAAETARFSDQISTAQCLQRRLSEEKMLGMCTAAVREECMIQAAIGFSNSGPASMI